MVKVYVWGDALDAVTCGCIELILAKGHSLADEPQAADVGIAPLLTRKLTEEERNAPRLGTLIYHPSLLPRHRGRDAIKWAYRLCEAYTGATWFWADGGYDTGDICEMEVLAVEHNERPRDFYKRAVVPAGIRMLGFILDDLAAGHIRRRPQIEEHSSYESPIPARTPSVIMD